MASRYNTQGKVTYRLKNTPHSWVLHTGSQLSQCGGQAMLGAQAMQFSWGLRPCT